MDRELGRFLILLVRSPFDRRLSDSAARRTIRIASRSKELIDAGRFAPVVDRSFPLAEVPAAIRYLETGAARGLDINIDG